jgi:hypothetical protein
VDKNTALIVGAVAAIGAAALWWNTEHRNEAKIAPIGSVEDMEMRERMRTFMQKDLENRMIAWKKGRGDSEPTFEDFLRDEFPENINFEGDKVAWIDERVLGPNWKGAFDRVKATDAMWELGDLPGTQHKAM